MKRLFYTLVLIPLLLSCESYKAEPFDDFEANLRAPYFFTTSKLKKMILDENWQKRDSLSYLRYSDIEQIYMSDTDSIPSWITRYKKLENIGTFGGGTDSTSVRSLPNDIGSLPYLAVIDISDQRISHLPASMAQLKSLVVLNLWSNRLDSIPSFITQLTSLESLVVSDNNIDELPESIGNLHRLTDLAFAGNNISVIPESIGKLGLLQHLTVSNNPITELPESMDNLILLEELDISNTQIADLPESIFKLTYLTSIDRKNTPLAKNKEMEERIKQLLSDNWAKKRERYMESQERERKKASK